jgi:hypothetical protein
LIITLANLGPRHKAATSQQAPARFIASNGKPQENNHQQEALTTNTAQVGVESEISSGRC